MRYGIDINENAVRIIKYANNGLIRKVGEAEFYTIHQPADADYALDLADSIRFAASQVGMPRGASASIVAGGPEVIVRKFIWPELPDTALAENAHTEFTPFLPGEANEYTISYEVIKKVQNEESNAINIEVLVAALPRTLVEAITSAVTKAGLKVTRIDVRENARAKLVSNCCIIDGGVAPQSFAVLDFSQSRANMGLYLNDSYYSSRYFVPTIFEEEPEPEPEFDENGEVIPIDESIPKPPPIGKYEPITLANDVVSVIDYMQYRERGSEIACILLIGEEYLPGIEEALHDSLDIPIYRAMDWLPQGIDSYVTGTYGEFILSPYLDAYATSFPSFNPKVPLNLRAEVKKSSKIKIIAGFSAAAVLVVGVVVAAITYFHVTMTPLREDIARMNEAIEQIDTGPEDIAEIAGEADILRQQIDDITGFFSEHVHAGEVLPILLDQTVGGNLSRNPIGITGFSISDSEGVLTFIADDFYHIADASDYMMENPLVLGAGALAVVDIPEQDYGQEIVFEYEMQLIFGHEEEEVEDVTYD